MCSAFIHKKLIHANTDKNTVVTQPLNPRIEARLVRINPQHFYGGVCARLELYGCSADQGKNLLAVAFTYTVL